MKRGLSPIVATVLLVLIVLAIALLIWTTIAPWLNLKLAMSKECLRATESMSIKQACIDINVTKPTNKYIVKSNLSILLERSDLEANIIKYQLGGLTMAYTGSSFRSTGEIYTIIADPSKYPVLKKETRKWYNFPIPENNILYIAGLRISPVVKVLGSEKICDAKEEVVPISWCENTRNNPKLKGWIDLVEQKKATAGIGP